MSDEQYKKTNHVCQWLKDRFAKEGFPDLHVSYWGHDPDDYEMGVEYEEDDVSGIYDCFMIPDDKLEEFNARRYDTIRDEFSTEFMFHLCLLTHSVSVTKEYYPEIYKLCQKT